MEINGVEYSDEELLEVNYKCCCQVITDLRKSSTWRRASPKEKLMRLKWFIDIGLEMKPEEVYENCIEYFEKGN